MEANELRIGNWVQRMTHAGYIKDQVHLGRENENTGFEIEQYDYFEPIPLTEEWLIKFGFEMINDFPISFKCYQIKGISFDVLKDERVVNNPDKAIEIYGNIGLWSDRYKHIKHVHQLQNLYHALNGEELEMK